MDSIMLFTILLFSIASLLQYDSASPTKNGFTFELIPRFSVDSPLYPGNLTDVEKIQMMANFSQAYALYMKSSTMGTKDLNIRPFLQHFNFHYVIRAAVGTIPPINVYFMVDTGSSPIWTQIEPFHPCFPQIGLKYKPIISRTYSQLPTNHPLCRQIHNGQCVFAASYLSGAYIRGILARDQFTFQSRHGRTEVVQGIVFATINESARVTFSSTAIGGIIGMGRGARSFVMQFAHLINGRFSYCMVNVLSSENSYLRFGSDVEIGRNVHSTPFVRTPNVIDQYHLDLLDISINRQPMKIPREYLQLRPDGTGGCVIDSGSPATFLIRPVYHAVKNKLMHYFQQYDMTPVSGGRSGFDLCYRWSSSFTLYPTMDLHFRGAALHLEKSSLFLTIREMGIFCLTMLEIDSLTLIGAAQQENLHVVYDVEHGKLYFEPANCAAR